MHYLDSGGFLLTCPASSSSLANSQLSDSICPCSTNIAASCLCLFIFGSIGGPHGSILIGRLGLICSLRRSEALFGLALFWCSGSYELDPDMLAAPTKLAPG